MTKYKLHRNICDVRDTIELPDNVILINVDLPKGKTINECPIATITYLEPVK